MVVQVIYQAGGRFDITITFSVSITQLINVPGR